MRGQRATPLHRVCGKRLQLWSQHYTAEAGAYFGTMWSDESDSFISSNNNGRVYTFNRAPGGNWTQV